MPKDPRATKKASEKVLYELDMFKQVYIKITNEWNESDIWTKNILIEVFLLHARILYDFLIFDPKRVGDMSAIHFLDCPESWKQARGQLCQYISDNYTRLNQMVAHLTYERIKYEVEDMKGWVVHEIYQEIMGAWQQFLDCLSPEQHVWFKNT
jgi:hypothetical protein